MLWVKKGGGHDDTCSHFFRVQEAVVDPKLDQLNQQLEDLGLLLDVAGHGVMLQRLDDHGLKETDVFCQHGSVIA